MKKVWIAYYKDQIFNPKTKKWERENFCEIYETLEDVERHIGELWGFYGTPKRQLKTSIANDKQCGKIRFSSKDLVEVYEREF